jgi:hypothetical protein
MAPVYLPAHKLLELTTRIQLIMHASKYVPMLEIPARSNVWTAAHPLDHMSIATSALFPNQPIPTVLLKNATTAIQFATNASTILP